MGEKIPGNNVASVWEFLSIMPVQLEMLLRNQEKNPRPEQGFADFWNKPATAL